MRDYGKVHSSFWSSDTIHALSEDGRMLALYLMTSPHTTITGTFRLPDGYACEDLKWTSERVVEGFRELSSNGFANRCETTKWVWICKHLEWNPPENPNQRKSAAKVALSVPDSCAWKQAFMRVFGPSLGIETINPSETLTKPFANQEQEQEQEQKKEQDSLRSSSSSAAPPTPPADLGKARSERLAQVTAEAIGSFNAALGKPVGLLPAINPAVGAEKRRAQVKRCLRVASQICVQQFGGPTVTREFWDAYWAECAMDEFKSGRQPPGKGHENWTPSFEYLTREAVMLEVFDRATSAGATA